MRCCDEKFININLRHMHTYIIEECDRKRVISRNEMFKGKLCTFYKILRRLH